MIRNQRNTNKKVLEGHRPSDCYKTPQQVFDQILKYCGVSRENLFDVFQYKTDWHPERVYNGFTAEWPKNFINFVNPPYSQSASALFKAQLEFLRGRSSVLLIQSKSVQGDDLKCELSQILGTVHKIKPVKFVGCDRDLESSMCLVYFLQPEVLAWRKTNKYQKLCEFKD